MQWVIGIYSLALVVNHDDNWLQLKIAIHSARRASTEAVQIYSPKPRSQDNRIQQLQTKVSRKYGLSW
jgi:hypothetical protein